MFTISRDNLHQYQRNGTEKRKIRHNKSIKNKKKAALMAGALALLLVGGVWFDKSNTGYALVVNGEDVLVFDSKAQAEESLDDFLTQKSQELGKDVSSTNKIEVVEVKGYTKTAYTPEEVRQALEKELSLLMPGAAILVNGKEAVLLPDQETAEKLVQEIKDAYTPQKENYQIVKVNIKEKVEIVPREVPEHAVLNREQAYQILTTGTEKTEIHQVAEGESFWTIAHEHGIKVDELMAANPDVKENRLKIGMKLNLIKTEPLMHVTTVAQLTEVKEIPFEVIVERDKNMSRSKEKVKQAGKTGEKKFTYLLVQENGREVDRQFVDAAVLTKPVTKVVVKGTKMVLASRSEGGGGSLRRPASGGITSRFGDRRLGYHTGVDIDGQTGDAIRAAEGGKVTFVGREGGYGKMIRIDHGSGVETWYAHLSAYDVSEGDEVERGQVIGSMGSTGRSTGSHLHFEVRINGNAKNPLNYID